MNKKVSYAKLENFVTKDSVNTAKHAIGNAASLKLTNRLFSCVLAIIFFCPIIYVIGTGSSKMGTIPDDIHVISVSTAFAMGAFDKVVPLVTKFSLIMFAGFAILNVVPKKNLAYQLFSGTIFMSWFAVNLCVVTITMFWGATLGGFGTVGFFLQLALVIYLIFMSLRNKITGIKAQIFPKRVITEHKSYTWVLTLGVVLVTYMNHFLFKIGYANLSPTRIELLTGWGLLIWGLIVIGCINLIFKQVVLTFYFAKYAERFRVDLGFSNTKWYGNKKAQKIKRRKLMNKNK